MSMASFKLQRNLRDYRPYMFKTQLQDGDMRAVQVENVSHHGSLHSKKCHVAPSIGTTSDFFVNAKLSQVFSSSKRSRFYLNCSRHKSHVFLSITIPSYMFCSFTCWQKSLEKANYVKDIVMKKYFRDMTTSMKNKLHYYNIPVKQQDEACYLTI